jgi:hypothetical protein
MVKIPRRRRKKEKIKDKKKHNKVVKITMAAMSLKAAMSRLKRILIEKLDSQRLLNREMLLRK